MNFIQTSIKDLWLAETNAHEDVRGLFARLFCSSEFSQINYKSVTKQINFSKTYGEGSIRGMHFQYPPYAEDKLVRCLSGKVYDVAIDLRKGSDTFLHWHGEILSAENWRMMVIPKGFAHGFQVLSERSDLIYIHSAEYMPEYEGIIHYSDPRIKIDWPLPISNASSRDENAKHISDEFKGI